VRAPPNKESRLPHGSNSRDSHNQETDPLTDQVKPDYRGRYGHNPDRCRTCTPDLLVYLTVADEWRRWALDFGHGFGSTRRAA
jgi:hypothetical protein